MNADIKVAKELNLRNLPCPMPVVKISKAVKEIAVGEVVMAITTDPGALSDFPAWAKSSGHEILATEASGEETKFYVKRLK
jgi:TusA-related sulfurtransferase